jgi:hypothetical protein
MLGLPFIKEIHGIIGRYKLILALVKGFPIEVFNLRGIKIGFTGFILNRFNDRLIVL